MTKVVLKRDVQILEIAVYYHFRCQKKKPFISNKISPIAPRPHSTRTHKLRCRPNRLEKKYFLQQERRFVENIGLKWRPVQPIP